MNRIWKYAAVCSVAVIVFCQTVRAVETVPQSARDIPLVREADVVIVGGSLAAVAAAQASAQAGAETMLVAPRPYVGDDLCASLELWRTDEVLPTGSLAEALFKDDQVTTPMRVKKTLEKALLDAGADFLLCSYPTDLLLDQDGSPTGLVIANRSGRQAIACKVIIDATPRAVVAKMAGARFRPWRTGQYACRRVVLGGDPSPAPPVRSTPSGIAKPANAAFHLYQQAIDLGDGAFPALAEAEQTMRDATSRPGQLRASECIAYVPSDSIIGPTPNDDESLAPFTPSEIDGLFVLGPCADIPREDVAAAFEPDIAEIVGARVGEAAARIASKRRKSMAGAQLGDSSVEIADDAGLDIRETLHGLRSVPTNMPTVGLPAKVVPVLAKADVVVVGGGTSGACAAIGAARAGADVLVVEYQEGLGGVGTMGLIGKAYHGRSAGFSNEVPFCDGPRFTSDDKMEWYRREIRKYGGRIWYQTIGCGAVVEGDRVRGAVVATPLGRGVILADVVIDATGNADLAAAAGAETMYGADADSIALQGTGLPVRSPGATYVNTDYLLVDESDAMDVWRALVGTRLANSPTAYDMAPFIQSRERRRVVGEFVMSYLDQIAGRTYPDSIVLSASDYDSHGYPDEPYFALIPHTPKTLKANHPAPGGSCYTPYRCLLPRGLDGMLVIGLGMSMRRDASAMVRMQRDMHNQGYAAGRAAAMAARDGCDPADIDVRALQQHLVEIGGLPDSVLTDADNFPMSLAEVREAVFRYADESLSRDDRCKALATVLAHPHAAVAPARCAFDEAEGETRLTYAKLLGFLGQGDGVPLLCETLDAIETWDAKIFQGSMAEYAHLPTPTDAIILALGYSRDPRALPSLLEKLDTLDSETTLSHHRSIALALEALGDHVAAPRLSELLRKPGMRGHAMHALEPLYDKEREKRRRTGALREIVLARALYRCGDHNGLGRAILDEYRNDIRGLFARHATAVLGGRK